MHPRDLINAIYRFITSLQDKRYFAFRKKKKYFASISFLNHSQYDNKVLKCTQGCTCFSYGGYKKIILLF